MQKKYQTKNSMMQTQKWIKLVINQDYTVLLKMKIIWKQFSINILLQEKTGKVIHRELIFLQKKKPTKHHWTSLWSGMIYPNKMQESIWSKSSIKIGKSSMLTIKDLLIQRKHSNLRGSLWEHSQVSLMAWIHLQLTLLLILRNLI